MPSGVIFWSCECPGSGGRALPGAECEVRALCVAGGESWPAALRLSTSR